MAYPKEIYDRAKETIDNRRFTAEAEAEERRQRFAEEEPHYRELQAEQMRCTMEVLRVIGMGAEGAKLVETLKKKSLAARAEIRSLLTQHGHPEDWLDTHYTCEKCGDTGTEDDHMCECYRALVKQLVLENSNERSPLSSSRFSDFKLSYYPDTASDTPGVSCREHMKNILDFCRTYAREFDRKSYSLLLYGETGLGKTHLSLAIAAELIDRGVQVIYDTTQNVMNRLERIHFGRESDENYEETILSCDLLILDDLGTEFVTQFTLSALYNIINTRLLANRPTIISTNLDLKGIQEKYTRRIASRIVGEYDLLRFLGSDIRQAKKNED